MDTTGSEEVYVQPVGPGLFRLEHTPIWANREDNPLYLGDVVELAPQSDGTYEFVRVAERAPLRHLDWVVPRRFVESEEYQRFGAAVEAAGGRWEGIFGGLLFVHLPLDSTFDADAELGHRIAAANSAEPEV